MKIREILYICVVAVFVACTADDDVLLSPEQKEMIGQRVDFCTTIAEPFVTRATYQHNGSFNEGDQMRIFRQYATDDTGTAFDETNEIFRTYYLKMDYASGVSVSLNSDWRPMPGKLKSDKPGVTEEQKSADSLTWENGKTVRFRAWGRSNLANALNAGTKASYYPDYTVSDWVTVSGPTKSIPLTMRHIACRIGITAKSGNELSGAEICLDWEDYKRMDNADTAANDATETGKTDDEAKAEVALVDAAIKKMCMPAGVDDRTFLLTAMTQTLYNGADTDFKNLEKYGVNDGVVKIGTMSADYIANYVQHPVFDGNDGRLYMMSIPFDMSSDGAGRELALPACTRFKVRLRGDNGYHIFVLSDIKDGNGNALFPNGLTLKAGYSYLFSVGYHYDKFTITAADSFSWTEQDLGEQNTNLNNDAQTIDGLDLSWWTDALKAAANTALAGGNFIPEFSIADQKQFVSFIKLVNGRAAKKMSGLTRGEVRIGANGDTIKVDGFATYWWIIDAETDENGQPKQITREKAIDSLGYIFYPHFYPTVSTQKAHVIEDYVKGPVDFYDIDFGNRYKVNLTQNLDLYDLQLPSIGENSNYPFRGNFMGNGHTLTNLNMESGYLFGYVKDGAITNLKIESTHNTCLLNTATSSGTTGWGCYIAGISMMCPSKTNSIATSLSGTSYVVGCVHVGSAGGALIGSADNLTMLGCMQVADGLSKTTGALLGASGVKWGSFMYNYYDTDLSPEATAIAGADDDFEYNEYIRGNKSHILKAVKDYMIGADVDMTKLTANMKKEMYGLAPWKAMNQGIDKYNASTVGVSYPCSMKYSTSTNYTNRYPTLN